MSGCLAALEVLIVDCQATGPSPHGHLLELGWARVTAGEAPRAVSRLVRLPPGERIPRRVATLTGLSDGLIQDGVAPSDVFRELAGAAASLAKEGRGAPTVVHFAAFEAPFLAALARAEDGAPPLDLLCTHAVARRLLPELPRRTLRALAGYFGRPVDGLRRAGEHVEATAFVWRHLVALLAEREGIHGWDDLRAWLASGPAHRARRAYPMPREVRLAAPDRPGLYRMLRADGSVLYVGKATSLKARVNSYFRRQSGGGERTLEMLSQARGISFTIAESALEAALAEPDEIKRHRPPYNVALLEDRRAVWFTSADGCRVAARADHRHRIGPFVAREIPLGLAALVRAIDGEGHADPLEILGIPERYAPPPEVLRSGIALFAEKHGVRGRAGLVALGARLWQDGEQEPDPEDADLDAEAKGPDSASSRWAPADVVWALERLVVRAAHALRRARWLCRMVDCAVVWSEPGMTSAVRLLIVENGEVIRADAAEPGQPAPVPPGAARSCRARRRALTVASFDRLRVLTTELRRIVGEGHAVEVRFDARSALSGERLRRALSWV